MADFKDLFSDVSAEYQSIRPDYPAELFSALAAHCHEHQLALDCAAGSGQAAHGLLPLFDRVILTDASSQQLNAAEPHLQRLVATAENIPLAGGALDLLIVAQALHWFDHARFFREASRVLKPDGVFAAWCYEVFQSEAEIDAVLSDYYHNTLDGYWAPERRYVDDGYRSIAMPFSVLSMPTIQIEKNWTFEELIRYLHTWSATRALIVDGGSDSFAHCIDRLRLVWGDAAVRKRFVWPVSIIAGRNRQEMVTSRTV